MYVNYADFRRRVSVIADHHRYRDVLRESVDVQVDWAVACTATLTIDRASICVGTRLSNRQYWG